MKVLLVNPPMSGPIGPYPSICYLAGFLKTIGVQADLSDASLQLVLRIFSPEGLAAVVAAVHEQTLEATHEPDEMVRRFLERSGWYVRTIDTAVACLQGRDSGAIARGSVAGFFPPPLVGPPLWATSATASIQSFTRLFGELTTEQKQHLFDSRQALRFAFGTQGATDQARYFASVMLEDISRVIRRSLDRDFKLDAYATRLPRGAATFTPLRDRLNASPGLIDQFIDATVDDLWTAHAPDLVGLTVPFVGSVYGAFRIARRFKQLSPNTRIAIGGGWVNTTLRHLSDPDVFDYLDFVTLDDGERPLQCLIEHIDGRRPAEQLRRTFLRRDGRVAFVDHAPAGDVPFGQWGTPTYRGLPNTEYLAYWPYVGPNRVAEQAGRWNKITLAHGCYWKKCTFCDTLLDYIGRFEPATVDVLVERIKDLKKETGESGFHFVDEAMPPALMRRLAMRLIDERVAVSWRGMVRFDEALAPLAPLLAESGCVRLSGGLEAASDRLLALMQKGVSLKQAARVTHALSEAGILVHIFLIYGFPTQTVQETIDAAEFVRQLFEAGCVHSAYWHAFQLTAASPIAADPERFGIHVPSTSLNMFGNYVLDYEEPGRADPRQFARGLKDSVVAYEHGVALDRPVQEWFETPMPAPSIRRDLVKAYLLES